MRRLILTLRYGLQREVRVLLDRGRPKPQTSGTVPEYEWIPAFDPTLPTRTTSYRPSRRGRRSVQGR